MSKKIKNKKGGDTDRTILMIKDFIEGNVELPWGLKPSFFVFLFVLIMFYIANALEAEKKLRTISDLTAEIRELGYEQVTKESELMNMSKQSEVLRRVQSENLELEELTEPPRIIKR